MFLSMFFLFDISLKLSMNLFKSFLSTLSFGLTIPIFVKEDKSGISSEV